MLVNHTTLENPTTRPAALQTLESVPTYQEFEKRAPKATLVIVQTVDVVPVTPAAE